MKINKDEFTKFAKVAGSEAIELRKDFHKHAEKAWTEFRTASILAQRFSELGLKVTAGKALFAGERENLPPAEELEACYNRALDEGAPQEWLKPMKGGYTGVVAEIGSGEPVTAMRFDIDALPFAECQEEGYRPFDLGYASEHEDACHSCGHDGHASMAYGVAKVLKQFESSIKGTIRLVVQPAEEGVQGAEPMVRAGVMKGVSTVFAAHLSSELKTGSIGNFNKKWASGKKFDVELFGKAAHSGCHPEGGINTMLAAAVIIQNLYALPRNSAGFTRVNVGKISAGTARNSISPYAYMMAETRAETDAINNKLYENALKVIENGAKMHGCEYKVIQKGSAVSAKGDDELIDKVKELVFQLGDIEVYEDASPNDGGCEDYTRMMKAVQEAGGRAVHFYVGADFRSEDSWEPEHRDMSISLHSSRFDINERALVYGTQALSWILLNMNQ